MSVARHPSETMLLEDGVSVSDYCDPLWPLQGALQASTPDAINKWGQTGNAVQDNFTEMNVAFLDGHVQTVQKKDLAAAPVNVNNFDAPDGLMNYITFYLQR